MRSIILICLFVFNFSFGQSIEKKGITQSELENAKVLYVKMIESADYKKKDELNETLWPILREATGYKDFLKQKPPSEESIRDWIKNNVAREKVEKALELFNDVMKLEAKIMFDNKDVYELVRRATREQVKEILKPLFEKEKAKYGF